MSTYFVGDIHGCLAELQELVRRIQFNPEKDMLYFVGDLINRGPDSVAVLRYIKSLGSAAEVVLGNHDISFIAYAYGVYHGKGSDFPEMMRAHDSEELLDWLRRRPLLIHDKEEDVYVVHAGIPPRWSLKQALKQARKAEKRLRGDKVAKYLKKAYGGGDSRWKKAIFKMDKFRYRINGFTRMRYCDDNGEPNFRDKCPVGEQRKGLHPWFDARSTMQNDGGARIVFGHWAALGYHVGDNAICIDSGCAWGNKLTAVLFKNGRMEKIEVSSINKDL